MRAIRRRLPTRTLSSTAAYSLWAASYPPLAHNKLMALEQTALVDLLPSLAGRDVLDLACGSGRYGKLAREMGARRVIGIDDSAAMLKRAWQESTVALPVQGDMPAIPCHSEAFDVVICALALGHLTSERMHAAVKDIGRVLRPGGVVVISDFHPFVYLSGGRRTFTASDGTQYAVVHHPHLISNYFSALAAANLTPDALSEPSAQDMRLPAVLVIRARKGRPRTTQTAGQ